MTPKRQSSKASPSDPVTQLSAGPAEEQPALNKDGSRRKSRVLRRKTDHSVIERRRREKINEKLVALQNLVPACRKECRDLIERKFAEAATSAPSAKRKREEEKLAKAQIEMQEKIKTSMVLEKLCIISHTLDFVNQLQEENEALRALCECQAQSKRRFSITSDVEMDEHYRDAHNLEAPTAAPSNGEYRDCKAADDQKRECLSSPEPDLLPETAYRNVRRRLHWGSDRVRESCSLTEGVCRHHEDQDVSQADDVLSHRCLSTSSQGGSTSPPAADCKALTLSPGGERECGSVSGCRSSVCGDSSCRSSLWTKDSSCREEEALSSSASDEPASPPPAVASWREPGSTYRQALPNRHLLPSILHLGLPNCDPHHAVLRKENAYSMHRKYPTHQRDLASSRAFRPLSLYTSQPSRPLSSSTRPL